VHLSLKIHSEWLVYMFQAMAGLLTSK